LFAKLCITKSNKKSRAEQLKVTQADTAYRTAVTHLRVEIRSNECLLKSTEIKGNLSINLNKTFFHTHFGLFLSPCAIATFCNFMLPSKSQQPSRVWYTIDSNCKCFSYHFVCVPDGGCCQRQLLSPVPGQGHHHSRRNVPTLRLHHPSVSDMSSFNN